MSMPSRLRIVFGLLLTFSACIHLGACDGSTTGEGAGGLPSCGLSVQGGHYAAGTSLGVMVSQDQVGAEIHYTLDSTVPVRTSARYGGTPIYIRVDSGKRVVLTVRAWTATDSSPWTRASYYN